MAAHGPQDWASGNEILVVREGFGADQNPEFDSFELAVAMANYFISDQHVAQSNLFNNAEDAAANPYFRLETHAGLKCLQLQDGFDGPAFIGLYSSVFDQKKLSLGKAWVFADRTGLLQGSSVGSADKEKRWHIDYTSVDTKKKPISDADGKKAHINIECHFPSQDSVKKIIVTLSAQTQFRGTILPGEDADARFKTLSVWLTQMYLESCAQGAFSLLADTESTGSKTQTISEPRNYTNLQKCQYLQTEAFATQAEKFTKVLEPLVAKYGASKDGKLKKVASVWQDFTDSYYEFAAHKTEGVFKDTRLESYQLCVNQSRRVADAMKEALASSKDAQKTRAVRLITVNQNNVEVDFDPADTDLISHTLGSVIDQSQHICATFEPVIRAYVQAVGIRSYGPDDDELVPPASPAILNALTLSLNALRVGPAVGAASTQVIAESAGAQERPASLRI